MQVLFNIEQYICTYVMLYVALQSDTGWVPCAYVRIRAKDIHLKHRSSYFQVVSSFSMILFLQHKRIFRYVVILAVMMLCKCL